MSMTDYRALCAELVDAYAWCIDAFMTAPAEEDTLIQRARALLAQPVAEGPTDEDLDRLWWQYVEAPDVVMALGKDGFRRASRVLLARHGRPTPQPVAVSERPWERDGWCDEQGRCWWTANKPGRLPPSWWMVSIPQSCTDGIMLPANALPTPEATND